MEAIILAGGFGTRLRPVIGNLPKPLAPVQGKPFIQHVLACLARNGVQNIVMSVGYGAEAIRDQVRDDFSGIRIRYACEAQPLGTGGAVRHALAYTNDEQVFVLNGDTLVKLDYRHMLQQHRNARLSIAVREVEDTSRYGRVEISTEGIITSFAEKGRGGRGYANAGVYVLSRQLFDSFSLPHMFSFETDFIVPHLSEIQPVSFLTNSFFIDIGMPEDYARAQSADLSC